MHKNRRHHTKKIVFFKPEINWSIQFDSKLINSFDKEVRYKMGQTIEALKKHGVCLTHDYLKEFGFIIDSLNKNRFHNHITHNHTTYVANWQKDEKKRCIYLVDLATHENFNFQKKFTPNGIN